MRAFSLAALAASLLALTGASPAIVKRSAGKMFNNPSFAPPPALSAREPAGNGAMFANPAFVAPPVVERGLEKRATPAAPYFVVYSDAWVSGQTRPPTVSQINGFNVFILSFLLVSGPADQAVAWAQLSASQRQSIKAEYNNAGIKLMVSAFGATDQPTSAGRDPVALANQMAQWVLDYSLDGIDVDYEDFDAINRQDGSAEAWLASFTKQLRTKLPQGQYIVTHAPVAPWFSAAKYKTGAYDAVNKAVGNLIDWYNIQFYNQGTSEYTTCDGLLTSSSSVWPNTAVFQLAANGVSLNKIVIGKPATAADAVNGLVSTSTLASCLQQGKAKGWSGGVMVWQYPNANAAWISAVRASSWPVSGGGGGTPTTTTQPSGPTGGTGGCAGLPAWSSGVAYTGNQSVTYNGHKWTAKWWTQAETPGGASGVWTDNGAC